MSKTQKNTQVEKQYYAVSKDGGSYAIAFTPKFVETAQSAASNLDKLISDSTPIALNLWAAYKHVVSGTGGPKEGRAALTALQFFHAIDQTIPTKYPKVGSPERKALNGHVIFNRLQYLTMKVGRTAAGDNPKPTSPKDRTAKANKRQATFVKWAEEAKIDPMKIRDLLVKVLGFVTKDGKLNKTGKSWYEAVVENTVIDAE